MAYQRTEGELEIVSTPCTYLRSKAMYVTGELQPSHADEQHSHGQNCWCNLTQHVLGPDDRPVSLKDCAGEGRQCFVGR
jgi:hypothetical protein